jgi:formylglycine-generating enzyme required for sulfatase activity
MGDPDGDSFERPVHVATVRSFYLDARETTAAEYRNCVAARRCTAPYADLSAKCNWRQDERQDHPINCIRWEQAHDYCEFVGKRLPTEEEWEYAARGSDARRYPWGSEKGARRLRAAAHRCDTLEVARKVSAADAPFAFAYRHGRVGRVRPRLPHRQHPGGRSCGRADGSQGGGAQGARGVR